MKRATSLLEWRSDDDEVRDREVFPRMVLVSPAHPSLTTYPLCTVPVVELSTGARGGGSFLETQ